MVVFIKVLNDTHNELVKRVFLDASDSSIYTSKLVEIPHQVNIESEEKIYINVSAVKLMKIAGHLTSLVC